ncbi:uncharacterized protein [Branchiostoma lanceolatum]|uniref:uncharacterized protein n=1 Tax=Branchiostoma lanceolatum TaxID=7740 RepID=UPI003453A395
MDRSGYLMDDLAGTPPPSPFHPDSNTRPVPVPDLWEVEDTPDPDFSSARILLPPERREYDDDDGAPSDPERESLRERDATDGNTASAPDEAPTSRRWRADLDGKRKNCPCSTTRICLVVCLVVVLCVVIAAVTWLYLTGRLFGRKNKNQGEAKLYLIGEDRAARTKAYCLDGSRPGYYFIPGTGSGKNKWRVHLDGGGSCDDLAECYSRSLTDNGSTRRLRTRDTFKGFLSTNQDENPDFFNWNVVYVHYCDGACFSSNRPEPVTQKGKTLYFRGKAILDAVLDDLNEVRGLTNATTVILSGGSAGGIAVYRQADHVRSRLSPSVLYKVFPGSGLMVWELNSKREDFFRRRAVMHGMLDGPDHPACLRAYPDDRWKCLLPQFAAPYVTSAMFVLNAAYDAWALKNILQLDCKPQSCSGNDLQALKRYQAEVIGVTANLDPGQGAFIPSCDDHSIITTSDYNEIMVGGKTPTEAFSDWFFDRTVNSSRYIDKMEWNPTC